ncbi:MAG: type III secretion protein [Pseudomonas sp.]|uniref:type III secretion protein n=1 Tax=Pseudomonas sp. TaxID=306 RepID=UPI003C788018
MSLFERWQGLIAEPLQFVRGPSLGACFAEDLPEAVLHALQAQPRFHPRLEQLLVSHYQLAPLDQLVSPLAADLPVLLLSDAQFARLPRLCGAIWHASTLSREIRREVVNELREGLGAPVFSQALALRQLGGAADLLRDPAELIEAIDRDGQGCIAAWLHAQQADLQGWLRLRFVFPQGYSARLPRDLEIVQAAAACLVAEDTSR